MTLPQRTEYSEALQNLRQCASDDELRAGELASNALGMPLVWSGNFADVYKVLCPRTGNTWAVKCFTRESPGLRERYREISAHLEQVNLPFMVDFQYVEPGLRVGARWVPFLKMRWVEGQTLNAYVGQRADQPKQLGQLLTMWPKLASRLREAGVAHGDLQHGNVLLVPGSETGKLGLKLVDYDGMFVPALAGFKTGEVGHPCYQHPQRLRAGDYHAEVDRFSHLAIYCALQGLTVGGSALWRRFDNSDNLLFREADFVRPGQSEVFRALWQLGDRATQSLVARLAAAAQQPLERVPLLAELAGAGEVPAPDAEAWQAAVALWDQTLGTDQTPSVAVPPPLPVAPPPVPVVPPAPGSSPEGLLASETQEEASGVEAAFARGFGWLGRQVKRVRLPSLRELDRGLGRLAGEGNTILHNFLRVVAVVVAVAIPVGFAILGIQSYLAFQRAAVKAWQQQWAHVRAALAMDRESQPAPPPTAEDSKTPPATPTAPFDAAAAGEHQQRWAELLQVPVRETNSIGMKFTLIPAGEFLMGSLDSDRDADRDEKPQHRVQINRPFYLGTYEVTQAEYERVMGTNPSRFKTSGPAAPVEMVSWEDAQVFCQKLSSLAEERAAARAYRLPTEAEWEYACRAGSTSRFCFGDDETSLGDFAWFQGNAAGATHAAGQKQPNAWGLHDMHGAVREWCQDWCDDGYYKVVSPGDPSGPSSGLYRVNRGGSWISRPQLCRSADRGRFNPSYRSANLGFRVARSPSGTAATPGAAPLAGPAPPPAVRDSRTPPKSAKLPGVLEMQARPPAPAVAPFDATVAAEHQQRWAEFLNAPVQETNSIGMQLTLIPGGEFLMGSPDSERDAGAEKPQHRVQITRPFYLGTYEVTQAEYERVMGTNPSSLKTPGSRAPVEQVLWEDAQALCQKLSSLAEERAAGRVYRLPTEAEWEYACRAGSASRFCFGDDETAFGDFAWFKDNSAGTTHPVGQKKPNGWGLYDMHGNVCEWCQDWYDPDYYKVASPGDPPGPSSGSYRVYRGGSCVIWPQICRSAYRFGGVPSYRSRNLGFRVARSLPGQ